MKKGETEARVRKREKERILVKKENRQKSRNEKKEEGAMERQRIRG